MQKTLATKAATCHLSGLPAARPFPSLSFCFRNNLDSCCIQSQDTIISENYAEWVPEGCSNQWV